MQFKPQSEFGEHCLWHGALLNDVNVDLFGTHDIGGGWTLRPATQTEHNERQITSTLEEWAQRRGSSLPRQLKPQLIPPATTASGVISWDTSRLMVVEAAENVAISSFGLTNAFAICDAEFRVGVYFGAGCWQTDWLKYLGMGIRSPLGELFDDRPLPSLENLDDLRDTVVACANPIPDSISNAIGLFISLDHMPDYALMKHLGYFTVIESLLSHAPSANDSADSIRRQLERNLILIDHRLAHSGRSLGLSDFDAKPSTVIGKLYSYRSAIAHGSPLEKPLKQLVQLMPEKPTNQILWANEWLRKLVRRVLFAAVSEPELVTDLK